MPSYREVIRLDHPLLFQISCTVDRTFASIQQEIQYAAFAKASASGSNFVKKRISSENESSVDIYAQEIKELVRWSSSHLDYLEASGIGNMQIKYYYSRIFPALKRYKNNVEEALSARRHQKTWSNEDTLWLP